MAEDVERLARLAYPGAEEAMILTLAKDQFIDALDDDDMKLRIQQLRPQILGVRSGAGVIQLGRKAEEQTSKGDSVVWETVSE